MEHEWKLLRIFYIFVNNHWLLVSANLFNMLKLKADITQTCKTNWIVRKMNLTNIFILVGYIHIPSAPKTFIMAQAIKLESVVSIRLTRGEKVVLIPPEVGRQATIPTYLTSQAWSGPTDYCGWSRAVNG